VGLGLQPLLPILRCLYYQCFIVFVADLPFLLYAKESQIRSLELDANLSTASHEFSFQPIGISNTVISMDFDSGEGYVYWVEQANSGGIIHSIGGIQAQV